MGRIHIPDPLQGLRGSCEVHCVAGCCGLDAFDFAAQHMAPWFREQNLQTGLLALTQLETLMAEASKDQAQVWSDQDDFNTAWDTGEHCLDFLEAWFREALKALIEVRKESLINPSWLAWNDGTIPRLAQAIYSDRRFSDLPILADAIEEAGCTDAEILAHCRAEGPHVRGCWVVDLLLRKE